VTGWNNFDLKAPGFCYYVWGSHTRRPSVTEVEALGALGARRSSLDNPTAPRLFEACSLVSPTQVPHLSSSPVGTIYDSPLQASCIARGHLWKEGECYRQVSGRLIAEPINYPSRGDCAACVHVLDRNATAVGLPAGELGTVGFNDMQFATLLVPENAGDVFTTTLDDTAPAGEYWLNWTPCAE
jgi:hypothetical protein